MPTTTERLEEERGRLLRRLDQINRAIAYLVAHPTAEEFLRDLKANY